MIKKILFLDLWLKERSFRYESKLKCVHELCDILDFEIRSSQRQGSEFSLWKLIFMRSFSVASLPMAFWLWHVPDTNSQALRHESAFTTPRHQCVYESKVYCRDSINARCPRSDCSISGLCQWLSGRDENSNAIRLLVMRKGRLSILTSRLKYQFRTKETFQVSLLAMLKEGARGQVPLFFPLRGGEGTKGAHTTPEIFPDH